MNDRFSSVKNSFEKLDRYVKKIQILELKWRDGDENPEVFNDADRTSIAEIFNEIGTSVNTLYNSGKLNVKKDKKEMLDSSSIKSDISK